MIEKKISFYSDGSKLEGTLYFPEDLKAGEKRPAIIPNSGYRGFNEFYPKLFAKPLTEAGYICLGFDYRGFAESEGEKGRVILDEQVEDIMNAITFLQAQAEVNPDQIGILGWGMGGSNVVRVAASDKRVKAVAALNGFFDGARWLSSIHSYVEWNKLLQEVEEDKLQQVLTGESRVIEPFHHYPLDPTTQDNVNVELVNMANFQDTVTLQFTESLLKMNAEKVVGEISPAPLFIAHGKGNLLHPVEESLALYEAAKEPKELYLIEGQHNDFMYADHAEFNKLMKKVAVFFERSLKINQSPEHLSYV